MQSFVKWLNVSIILFLSQEGMGQTLAPTSFDDQQLQTTSSPILSDWDAKFAWEFQFLTVGVSMRDKLGMKWSWGIDGSLGFGHSMWIHYPSKIQNNTLEVYSVGLMLERQLTEDLFTEVGYARIGRLHDLHTVIEHRGSFKYALFVKSRRTELGIKFTLVYGPNGRGESSMPADTELQMYSSLLVVRFPVTLWKNGKAYKTKHLKH